MKRILIASTALVLIAMPAQAQLLGGGGGGLGGVIGGTIGGAGSIGSIGSIGSPGPATDAIGTATRGTLRGSGDARGSARADRRSGRVDAEGQGSGSLTGDLTGALGTPAGTTDATGRGNASAAGSGSASAQLIGTDAVRSTAGSLTGQARTTGQAAAQQGQGLVGVAEGLAGGAQGSASGAAAGSGSATSGPLAAAGSLAGQGEGAFAIEKGTAILAPDGDRIGRVRQVVTDARGNVQQLLVRVDGEQATLPANYFQASGNGLISVIGEGQIKQIAEQQDAAENAGS